MLTKKNVILGNGLVFSFSIHRNKIGADPCAKHAPCCLARIGLALLILVLVAFLASPLRADEESMSNCVDRILAKLQPTSNSLDAMWGAANYCRTIISARQDDYEQQIRSGNYLFQRSENNVLMWMVVAITIAGIVLAAAQLGASYKLAKMGRGALADGGSVDWSKDKLAVQSSVVGVVVLAISFAFFLVFVIYVYTFREPRASTIANAEEPPHQIRSGPLQPYPTGTVEPK